MIDEEKIKDLKCIMDRSLPYIKEIYQDLFNAIYSVLDDVGLELKAFRQDWRNTLPFPEDIARNEWISIKDSLPPENRQVLWYAPTLDINVFSGCWEQIGKEKHTVMPYGDSCDSPELNECTHWRELPRGLEEKQEEIKCSVCLNYFQPPKEWSAIRQNIHICFDCWLKKSLDEESKRFGYNR